MIFTAQPQRPFMFVFFSLKVTYANKGTYVLKDRRGMELSMIDVFIVGKSA